MKLWTMQPKWIFERLMSEGEFYFKSDIYHMVEEQTTWNWGQSYSWLKSQMLLHGIAKPEKAQDLGWAWYKWTEKQPMPQGYWIKQGLNSTDLVEPVNVRIELNIDENRVLLSHYDAWHFVLNYSYLGLDWEAFDLVLENTLAQKSYIKPLNHPKWDTLIQDSWTRIFDMALCDKIVNEDDNNLTQNPVQATFWHLLKEDVVKAEEFSFKGKKTLLYSK